MEGFIINLIAIAPFSVGVLMIFFFIYYFYLGKDKDVREEGKVKRLGKRILK